ncbi:MAG: tRNA (adenosine(37)-N6)-threonylcarbamoyltransferase complex ATPase subunit type 1 TsaE [Bacteroidota bacterium]
MVSEIFCENQIAIVAQKVLKTFPRKRVFAFYGEMGAGKTTLIKGLCNYLGVLDTVTSPTFSIVNEYQTLEKGIVYHFDFYRINKMEEAMDMGYEEYFFSGNYCFVEWPGKIENLLPEDCQKLYLYEYGKQRHLKSEE